MRTVVGLEGCPKATPLLNPIILPAVTFGSLADAPLKPEARTMYSCSARPGKSAPRLRFGL